MSEYKAQSEYFSVVIQKKLDDTLNSTLSPLGEHLLKIFFDLAQQYDGLDSFYEICRAVPEALHPEIRVVFAVLNSRADGFQLVGPDTSKEIISSDTVDDLPLQASFASCIKGDILLLPVVARPYADTGTHESGVDLDRKQNGSQHRPCLGFLFVLNYAVLGFRERVFLEKLVNCIGYDLQRRRLQAKHIEHINFLRRLGNDIGHNVIVPNMHFKNLFRQLEKKINNIDEVVQGDRRFSEAIANEILLKCRDIRADLISSHEDLLHHYNRTSLYMETLLRSEHFTQGHLVLKQHHCHVEKEIILPELEVYRRRFERLGITIERPLAEKDNTFSLKCDPGLLSQVFDNLFSNAAKYTTTSKDCHGNERKVVAYGYQPIAAFPVPGKTGVKFTVFSTGNHLDERERLTIYEEGVRGNNSSLRPGSGHGLYFVRNVIEIHGGVVGYEAVSGGNNFFFILPLVDDSLQGEPSIKHSLSPEESDKE